MFGTITKRAIKDGYYKTFDLFNQVDLGSEKYDDINPDNYEWYYRIVGATMLIVIFWAITTVSTSFYFMLSGNTYTGYIFVFLYLLTFAPMFYSGVKNLIVTIGRFLTGKK